MAEKCCGTCKWWEDWQDAELPELGVCQFKLPVCAECPWEMVLDILNGEYVTDEDVKRERDEARRELKAWKDAAGELLLIAMFSTELPATDP